MSISRKIPSGLPIVVCGMVLLGLTACGGSSGGGDSGPTTAPAAPVLTLTPQSIKTFSFSWADVAGETGYRLLENPDGSSGYTEVASIAANATSHELEVFLPGRINASYILEACNSIGCSASSTVFVSGTLAEAVGYVKASNSGIDDQFGFNVALSGDGNTLAVGANNESSDAIGIDGDQHNDEATDSGAVYIFSRSGDTWSQQAYLKASNTGQDDNFGWSVALSDDGNTLAVGARNEDSDATGIDGDQANDDAPNSGAVYVFNRSGGIWSQQAYVKASNTEAGDRFGESLALSGDGNTLAVGANAEDSNATGIDGDEGNNAMPSSGAVYVYTRSGTTWLQQAYVKASNTGAGDLFGWSVALSDDGNTLAVGARGEASQATGIGGNQDNDEANNSGAVYVFTRSGGSWSQQAYVKASNAEAGDQFGHGVALSGDGNTLAVGAISEASNATGIGGDEGNNALNTSGAVYVYTRSGTTWSQQAYVKASNTDAGDRFGWSLALSGEGSTLAVGTRFEDSNAIGINGDQDNNLATNSGAVYIFTRSGGTWSQQAYVKASNTDPFDSFGQSIALSNEGTTLAVGAWLEESNATGIGGDQGNNEAINSGAVYLY